MMQPLTNVVRERRLQQALQLSLQVAEWELDWCGLKHTGSIMVQSFQRASMPTIPSMQVGTEARRSSNISTSLGFFVTLTRAKYTVPETAVCRPHAEDTSKCSGWNARQDLRDRLASNPFSGTAAEVRVSQLYICSIGLSFSSPTRYCIVPWT